MKILTVRLILILIILTFPMWTGFSQTTIAPGQFSRMGFGARGIAMGNALTSVIDRNLGSYYNPAIIAFSTSPYLEASYGFLSLDRHLNFLHFSTRVPPAAGFSFSVINSGVSNIDARTRDGIHTGYLSTSENQFSFAFGGQITGSIATGLAIKLYYHNLYEDMSSTTVGFDAGIIFKPNTVWTFGASVKDINSKYSWDSSKLYGTSGRTTTDRFPLLYQIGASYLTGDGTLLVAAQTEYSRDLKFIFRIGIEARVTENVTLRGGVDNLFEMEMNKPSLGMSIYYPIHSWNPSFHYSIVFEPVAPSSIHIISVGFEF